MESVGGNEYWDQGGKGKAGRKCVSSELCECQASMEKEVRRPWMARAGRKLSAAAIAGQEFVFPRVFLG